MNPNLELGVIGNCQISALIDSVGRYVWACLPRMDGDPVFSALLRQDEPSTEQGLFSIELQGQQQAQQRYLPNTAILETILSNEDGAQVRMLDFCPRFRQYGRNFRPVMMIRIVEPLTGPAVIRARLRPTANYGQQDPARQIGISHLKFHSSDMAWRLTTDMSLSAVLEERPVLLHDRVCFVMGADEPIMETPISLCNRFLQETEKYWRDWARGLAIPFEWQSAVIRAAITLKLCTFEDTGAVLAALTTSIPEAPNSTRNWDYRFCWLRDSYFTIHALNRLGATRTMEGYLHYIANVVAAASDSSLQPVYGISGETLLTENFAPTLPGYRGMGPVRVGNQAYEQIQHDVYGAVILAAMQSFFDSRLDEAGQATFIQLERAGERCWELYDQPDAGLWEYRGRSQIHSFSSVMCWAGVDRLARIAAHLGLAERAQFWRERADHMHKRIMAAVWNEQLGTFTEAWHKPTLDASVLLFADLNFVTATDPKFVATVRHLGKHLRRGDYMMRYIAADDFGAPENAFNICTFWYINALASIGHQDEARQLFENMLKYRTKLGLLSEDLDTQNGELWGNFPQTYSLVGIINSGMHLSQTWEDAL
ncbi:MAG: glycoside hydrolase family 15 protein [Steroidobacteraceae bacterium]